jgi:hypothetical protein
MKEVRGYLGNQFGFSETGRYILDTLIKPRIGKIGIIINDPFIECAKELDFDFLSNLEKKMYKDVVKFWEDFNKKVQPINDRLMDNSDCMLAILDGSHAVDDGTSSEIGRYCERKHGPIFGLRSDFRISENIAAPINPQIEGYITKSGGKLVYKSDPAFVDMKYPILETWFAEIKKWYDSFILK